MDCTLVVEALDFGRRLLPVDADVLERGRGPYEAIVAPAAIVDT